MILDIFRVTPRSRRVKLTKRNGVLFSNPGPLGKISFYFGTFLFCLSIFYAVYLYYPLGSAVLTYWRYKNTPEVVVNIPKATPTEVKLPGVVPTGVAPTLPTKTDEYSITIPKIMATANIVENVSPYSAKEYLKVLENNVVAQAKDTSDVDKGNGHTTYIFAHSTQQGYSVVRNNSVFYLLGELKNSDVVYINRFGTIYTYQVYNQKIVNASQTEYLKYSEPDKELLILQTCWPIGTDWKRLLVFAKRVK